MAKRFYWLKLPDSWFRQKEIKKLRRIAGGDTYTIIYLKMLLVAIKQDGKLFFEGVEEDFYEELALEIDEEPENVKMTLSYLFSQHLIEPVSADEYSLPEAKVMTGSESESAERMRRMRDKRASQCDVSVTQRLRLSDTEIEKEIEIDKRDIKTFCPEPDKSDSGQQTTTKESTVDNCVEIIDTSAGSGVQVIDTRKEKTANNIAKQPSEVFIQLPLNTGDMYDVTTDYVNEKKKLFPAINVEQEFLKMRSWCDDNEKNRKTKKGIRRFINNWLSNAQNKEPRVNKDTRQKNRFNNFEQRNYDWDTITDLLIQKQMEEFSEESKNAKTDIHRQSDSEPGNKVC